MFQEGINNTEFLTKYTNEYLKQALANLGQRLSVKGDGVNSNSFQIKELFPNYLGNWDDKELCVNVKIFKNEYNELSMYASLSKFKQYIDKQTNNEYYKFENIYNELGFSSNQYSFQIDILNDTLDNLANYYNDDISLSNGLSINDVDYWQSEYGSISKSFYGYTYKLIGINDILSDNPHIVEGIFEDIKNDGTLNSAIRLTLDDI